MSQQHNVEGSEQIAPSAASEAPLNGDAHVNEASDGEHDKPAVNQELPAANNDSITAQNTEAQKPAAESAQPTQAAEKKKKFPWFRKVSLTGFTQAPFLPGLGRSQSLSSEKSDH